MTLDLDDYEAANLRAALEVLAKLGLDTGDWLGQIRLRIPSTEFQPNVSVEDQVDTVRRNLRYAPC